MSKDFTPITLAATFPSRALPPCDYLDSQERDVDAVNLRDASV